MTRWLPHRIVSPFSVALFVALAATAAAQVPRTISFQGVLADASGEFVPDGVHRLTLRLYDSPSAGSAIYLETHDAVVVRGVFNVIIGSQTPLPASIAFDRAYFLGVSVGAGSELAPRTPLTSVPYALRAAVANDLAPGASVVRSLNGRSGELTLQGGGATTVTQSGSTITISSSGGGGASGIQGVQNTDGTISVANPNGPVATLGITDSAITGRKLAAGSITATHLAAGSVTQAAIASTVRVPPSGMAGGDLAGTYPSPEIAPDAVKTAKLANDAVTSDKLANDAVTTAKILNGTITGQDISATAALAVASVATTGGVTVGGGTPSARLSVQASGTAGASNAIDVTDNTGTLVARLRDDGNLGLGVGAPVARLDVSAPNALAIQMRTGALVTSSVTVVAGPALALPNVVSVRIANDGVAIPINLIFPAGVVGQVMIITNDDPDAVVGPVAIASGQTRMVILVGGVWRVVT